MTANHGDEMDTARAVYLVGRSHRQLPYTTDERTEIIAFITAMALLHPPVRQVVRLENTEGGFAMQSDTCLGKNLQRICRFIKYRQLTKEESTACNRLLACVWAGRSSNSYSRIIDGLLNVLVSGIDIGALKVAIDGIARNLHEQDGILNVGVDGIETGFLKVGVNVEPVQEGHLAVHVKGVDTGFLKVRANGLHGNGQHGLLGSILARIDGLSTGHLKVVVNGLPESTDAMKGNLLVHMDGIETGFLKVNANGLSDSAMDGLLGQLMMNVNGIETGTLQVAVADDLV